MRFRAPELFHLKRERMGGFSRGCFQGEAHRMGTLLWSLAGSELASLGPLESAVTPQAGLARLLRRMEEPSRVARIGTTLACCPAVGGSAFPGCASVPHGWLLAHRSDLQGFSLETSVPGCLQTLVARVSWPAGRSREVVRAPMKNTAGVRHRTSLSRFPTATHAVKRFQGVQPLMWFWRLH